MKDGNGSGVWFCPIVVVDECRIENLRITVIKNIGIPEVGEKQKTEKREERRHCTQSRLGQNIATFGQRNWKRVVITSHNQLFHQAHS